MQKSGIFNLVDRFCTFIFNLNNHTFGLLEIYCPALEVPFRGLVAPTSCTDDRASIRRNTVCSYGCEPGHYIAGGDNSLVCQINGLWNGNVPYCKRKCLCYNLYTHGTMIYSSERQVICYELNSKSMAKGIQGSLTFCTDLFYCVRSALLSENFRFTGENDFLKTYSQKTTPQEVLLSIFSIKNVSTVIVIEEG